VGGEVARSIPLHLQLLVSEVKVIHCDTNTADLLLAPMTLFVGFAALRRKLYVCVQTSGVKALHEFS
jgi:hypothetical protein